MLSEDALKDIPSDKLHVPRRDSRAAHMYAAQDGLRRKTTKQSVTSFLLGDHAI